MTDITTYVHSEGNSLALPTNNLSIQYVFHQKRVEPGDNKSGKTVDPNRVLRVFTLTTKLTSAQFNTLDGYVRPGSAPTYGTYPYLTWYRDGSNSENTKVAITGKDVIMLADATWQVTLTFSERSDS